MKYKPYFHSIIIGLDEEYALKNIFFAVQL